MYTEKELTELEHYFKSSTLPKRVRLSQCEVIIDIPNFIKNTIALCRAYPELKTFEAAHERLCKLKQFLEIQ